MMSAVPSGVDASMAADGAPIAVMEDGAGVDDARAAAGGGGGGGGGAGGGGGGGGADAGEGAGVPVVPEFAGASGLDMSGVPPALAGAVTHIVTQVTWHLQQRVVLCVAAARQPERGVVAVAM